MSKGSAWFSDLRVRNLTNHIAPRIYPHVERAVASAIHETISAQLPGLLMEALRRELPDAVPKHPAAWRRDRRAGVLREWNGHNKRELAVKYGVALRTVQRWVKDI